MTYSFLVTSTQFIRNRKTIDIMYAFNAAASFYMHLYFARSRQFCRRASFMQLFQKLIQSP